jgi:AraC-like DNA-binding protein
VRSYTFTSPKTYDLENQFNLTTRTLQRLFSRYAGVSPSWVIRRYRLHDAVDQLDQGEIVDWPALAVDLGYFDQAHFIKDFKKIIGVSPGKYVRRVSQGEN